MAMGAKVRFLSSFSFFFFSPSFFSPSLYLCLSFFLFQQIQTHYSSSSSTILETHDYLSNEVSPFLYPPTLSPPLPNSSSHPVSHPPSHPVCFPNIPALVCDCDGLSSRRNVLLSHLVPPIWREAFAPGFRLHMYTHTHPHACRHTLEMLALKKKVFMQMVSIGLHTYSWRVATTSTAILR